MERSRQVTYSLEEAAQVTGYAQVTLRRAIRRGKLTPIGSDGERRISRVELERWYRSLEEDHRHLFSGQGPSLSGTSR